MKKLMLIDGNSLIFRAYYATAYSGVVMSTSSGVPTNAVYALANMLRSIITHNRPDYCLVAFDTHKPTFRHEKYDNYKAGRKETPSELLTQFPLAKDLLKLFGFNTFELEGYEADDIVGTMARIGSEAGLEVQIYSGDRDLLQLIDENTTVYLTKKGLSELLVMNPQTLYETYGVTPSQIPDLKGLMGDASDNIPGIPGVGEKTAVKLLQEYGTLEKILVAEHKGKLKEKIENGKSLAIMSKEIATIFRDVPFNFTLEDIYYKDIDIHGLKEYYIKYEMRSLLSRLNELNSDNRKEEKIDYEVVEKFNNDFEENSALIVEYSTNNAFNSTIFGFAVSDSKHTIFMYYDDAIKDKEFLKYLKNNKKIGIDIKKDMSGLRYRKIDINNYTFDLLLAIYLLDPKVSEEPSSLFGYFNIDIPSIEKINKINKNIDASNLPEELINYACSKAYYLFKVKELVVNKLKEVDMMELYSNIELPLTHVLSKMEVKGVSVNRNILNNQAYDISKKLEIVEEEIYQLANEKFNIKSPNQIAHILFDVLGLPANRKRSTASNELEFLKDKHPIVEKILAYRKYQKLLSNYLVGLQNYIYDDGKLHTIFNQALTQTGRLSSRDPNLQNISIRDEETRNVRKAFVPSDEEAFLLSIDYSQIELRVLASLSNATSMIEAFKNNVDIHTLTASKTYGVSIDDVDSSMRRNAKATNFGIVYGMSDWGLAEQLGISLKDAKNFISKYYETYPEIKTFLNELIAGCEKNGYVKTIMNRIRYVPEIHDNNYNIREFGKRVAMNSPIQGTAADIIKKAMIDVDELLVSNNFKTKMILQIHDELIFEVPVDELMIVIPLIVEKMENAVKMQVPLKVDYDYGTNWYDC